MLVNKTAFTSIERKTYSINIGERVLGLSVLGQNTGSNLVDLADQVEHRVVRQLAESEFALGHVTGISLAQNGVTVARNNTAGIEGRPEVVLDGLVAKVVSNGFLHLSEPVKNFLVGPVELNMLDK